MAQKNIQTSPRPRLWLTAVLAALLAAIAAGGALLLSGRLDTRRIARGVSVSGLSVGGMRGDEASAAIRDAFDPAAHTLRLSARDITLSLSPEETGGELNIRALVHDALDVEQGNVVDFSLAPYLSMDEERLYRTLEQTGQQLEAGYSLPSFTLEGQTPPLAEGSWQDGAAMPTLAVTLGTPGYIMDTDAAVELVFAALAAGGFDADLSDALTVREPPAPDAEEILQAVSLPPVDARMDKQTKLAIPGSYGMVCDAGRLALLLGDAAFGQTVRVTMESAAPAVLGQEVYFQDVLGYCQTPHGANENRNANLTMACRALNGVVLQPGETISYNATLGQRTEAGGYRKAPAYSGTALVDSLGGGICQVSSTLYLSSLYAELETVERISHGYPATYMPIGLDATVSWGKPDLKLRNNGDLPVKLVAEVSGGFVRVWIMGTETRDYYVRMAFGSSTGGYAKSYYCRYDNKTHALISKSEAALSSYLSVSVAISGEIGSSEAYVNGNIREQPPCSPGEETLEAAKNYRPPNTMENA